MSRHSALLLVMLVAVASGLSAVGCDDNPKTIQAVPAPPPPTADAPPPTRTYDYTHKVAVDTKRHAGQRWTIALLRFGDDRPVEDQPFGKESEAAPSGGEVNVNVKVVENEAARQPDQPPARMNTRAREILKNKLIETEQFTVVERERILDVLRELNFSQSKYVAPETSPEQGQIISVRYLIEGSMGVNEDKTLKDTLTPEKTYKDVQDPKPGLLQNLFNRGRIDRQRRLQALRNAQSRGLREATRRVYSVSCYLSVYDVRTGEVVASVMGLGSNGLEAIGDAVEELTEVLLQKDDGVRVAAVIGEKVYLDIGSDGGIKVGDRFQIIHRGREIRNRHGQVIGYQESEVGEVEVTEARDQLSIAKIVTQAGQFARGDQAKPAMH